MVLRAVVQDFAAAPRLAFFLSPLCSHGRDSSARRAAGFHFWLVGGQVATGTLRRMREPYFLSTPVFGPARRTPPPPVMARRFRRHTTSERRSHPRQRRASTTALVASLEWCTSNCGRIR